MIQNPDSYAIRQIFLQFASLAYTLMAVGDVVSSVLVLDQILAPLVAQSYPPYRINAENHEVSVPFKPALISFFLTSFFSRNLLPSLGGSLHSVRFPYPVVRSLSRSQVSFRAHVSCAFARHSIVLELPSKYM